MGYKYLRSAAKVNMSLQNGRDKKGLVAFCCVVVGLLDGNTRISSRGVLPDVLTTAYFGFNR